MMGRKIEEPVTENCESRTDISDNEVKGIPAGVDSYGKVGEKSTEGEEDQGTMRPCKEGAFHKDIKVTNKNDRYWSREDDRFTY